MYRQTTTDLLEFSGRMILRALDTDGASGQFEGPGGQLLQSGDVDRIEPYGFASQPPVGTEAIVVSDEPQPSAIDRAVRPTDLPALAAGDSAIYGNEAKNYVRCHGTDVTVKAASARPAGTVHLGCGGTEHAVAYAGVPEGDASAVAAGALLNTFTTNAVADLAELRSHLVSAITKVNSIGAWAVGLGYTDVVITAPDAMTAAAIPEDQNHSYVATGSSTTKVDI